MKVRKKTKSEIVVSSHQVIDRSKWRFGATVNTHLGSTRMLNEQGFMCCLGQICANSGFGEDLLLNQLFPRDVVSDSEFKDIPWLTVPGSRRHTHLTHAAANINDSSLYTKEEREEKLIELFAKHGMTIEFKGKYPEGVK